MTFNDVITKIPGIKHYYPLSADTQARDLVGTAHGTNHGAKFGADGATFDGKSYVELPDNNDFSAATTGEVTIIAFLTITNWRGAGSSEYIHWMGKGVAGAHEWTFRHYVQGGTGEAPQRQGRTSFYCFNASGGLGAGSFFQDAMDSTERMVTGIVDKTSTYMYRDGVKRDQDALSGYSIKPTNTSTPVRIGTRDMSTGYLVGKIRRVAFFNRKLTDAEIKAIYSARNQADGGGTTPPPTPDPTPDPTPKPPDPTPTVSSVRIGNSTFPLSGMNVERGENQLIMYTPAYGATTRTNKYGTEANVVNGKVSKVVDRSKTSAPASTIPKTGYVLSGHGTARAWLNTNAKKGAAVQVIKV